MWRWRSIGKGPNAEEVVTQAEYGIAKLSQVIVSLRRERVHLFENYIADRPSLQVIPHTLKMTTLGGRQVGAPVNIESDMLAKYVERMMSVRDDLG